MTTAQILAELKNLSNKGGELMLKRLDLAILALADIKWIEETHKGDLAAARTALQADFFGDLCGAMSLAALLKCRKHFPNESDWKQAKWNVQAMYAAVIEIEARNKPATERKPQERPTIAAMTELTEKMEAVEDMHGKALAKMEKMDRSLSDAQCKIRDLTEENSRLRKELHSLQLENANLRGRLNPVREFAEV